jgi:hypothetical protein
MLNQFLMFKIKIPTRAGPNTGASQNNSTGTGAIFKVGAIISFRICKTSIYSPILSSF